MAQPILDDDSMKVLVKTINEVIETAQNSLNAEVNDEAKDADAPTLSIVDLDDYFLECILNRLPDLCCLMQAAHVSKRFQSVAKRVCRHRGFFRTLQLEKWEDALPFNGDLYYFMQLVRDQIREIKVTERLNVFLQFFTVVNGVKTLPLVRSCDLMEYEDFPHGTDLLALRLHFPKLEYLRVAASVTGHFLHEFDNLQELILYDGYEKEFEIKDEHLREICTRLKNLRTLDVRNYGVSNLNVTPILQCQSLQVLRLNLNALKPILYGVLALPNLRTLNVKFDRKYISDNVRDPDNFDQRIYETSEFFAILKQKAATIIGLAIDCNYLALNDSWDQKNNAFLAHNKLRWLAYCGCDFNPAVLLKYTAMTDLTFLCLRNWKNLTNCVVLQFVGSCFHLTHIDLTFCMNINWPLLTGLERLFKQIHRTRPLHIYYEGSGLVDELEGMHKENWLSNKFFIFHKELPLNSDEGLSYVDHGFEFEFDAQPTTVTP